MSHDGAPCRSPAEEIENDLPETLTETVENGTCGRDYLRTDFESEYRMGAGLMPM